MKLSLQVDAHIQPSFGFYLGRGGLGGDGVVAVRAGWPGVGLQQVDGYFVYGVREGIGTFLGCDKGIIGF